jgi:hypothetical protein
MQKAKIELSSAPTTDINLPFITADAGGARHMNMPLSRTNFENLVEDLIDRTIEPCKNCIKDAGVTKCVSSHTNGLPPCTGNWELLASCRLVFLRLTRTGRAGTKSRTL